MDTIIIAAALPLISAYAVFRVVLCLTPWPPTTNALISGFGGALYWWGQVLRREEVLSGAEWDFALIVLGIALMVAPELYRTVRDARG